MLEREVDSFSDRPTYRPMASPEVSLAAFYVFSLLLSTSDARRLDPGDVHVDYLIAVLAAISVARRQDVIAVTLDTCSDRTKMHLATNGAVDDSVKTLLCDPA